MSTRFDDTSGNDPLDELLGLDPTPELTAAAKERIRAGLAESDDRALDALLGLDDVEVPAGLSARVLARCREDAAPARGRTPILRFAAYALPAAAAVLLLVRPWANGDAPAVPEAPSAELLAALPTLEDMEFLTEELDPFEAEALFLFDDDEDVLVDLAIDAGVLEDNG